MSPDHPEVIAGKIIDNIGRVLVGKKQAAELCLVALGCGGHLLLEDVPGVGKTMLARSLACSLGLSFNRIQCTPDLLPSDITGVSVFSPQAGTFTFRPGPVMANIVLVDEVNRATPRTQSGLLEVMAERQVTVDGQTYPLPEPFMVVATENPIEFEGTFPLPEAQLDRFLMRISLGYPAPDEEAAILSRLEKEHPIKTLQPVVSPEEVNRFLQAARDVFVEESLRDYIVELVGRTRHHPALAVGASPRGSIALFQAARVLAVLRGRNYVLPEDIKYLAPFVLAHRLILTAEAQARGEKGFQIMQEIISATPVPTEEALNA
ncbi:MAG TPA: MoxR family ATPase [Firmicutes bacterium]|uniref:MoxR family ATPase n=1 Tax=Capillibacterium thermochitinicola TaxID=2699427 RepID=A0A8J6HQL0_9FIRM|nr:MoxR family ATPase [Capillibacterium thermochitinicola]MBA2132246.1 MoxR family ATPase [Capillibacterium thermochitinicola]HHW12912.1 MoxR family ATPase [Bacillota bacterium]